MNMAAPSSRAEMPFLEHLRELRTRIVRSLLAILIMTIVCYNFTPFLFSLITSPLYPAFANAKLIGTGPADAFLCEIHISIAAGIILSAPFWFYQMWLFLEPGMNDKERRFAIPFVICSTVFFVCGILFCFKIALPAAFHYFSTRFDAMKIGPDLRIREYLSFVVKISLIFGIVFELPIASYFLARLRLLTHTWLMKNFRYSFLGMFICAAVLTPPDVVSQLLLAGPLVILYGLSIIICYVAYPKGSSDEV